MVTVIITTAGNKIAELGVAIRSVLMQTYKDLELIVVSNGENVQEMTDFLNSFKDIRIRSIFPVYHSSEYASVKNLNAGLRYAKGKYITILDDDDYWTDPQKLEKQVKFLEDHSDYVAVGTNGTVVQSGGILETNLPLDDATLRENALLNNPIAHTTSMYRRVPLHTPIFYDEKLKRAKDWDLFLRLGSIGKFGFCNKLANLPDNTVTWKDVRTMKKRRNDAYWCLKVMWKHRHNAILGSFDEFRDGVDGINKRWYNQYPHFAKAFTNNLFRWTVFTILSVL